MNQEILIQKDFGQIKNWIGGKYVASDTTEYNYLFTPYTGEVIGEYPVGTKADLDHAVHTAKEAFKTWGKLHIKDRTQVMFRFKSLLERDIDQLAQLAALECGKLFSEAKAEVLKGIEILEYGCSIPNKILGEYQEVSTGVRCRSSMEPQGVVASIAPFNFPNMVPMWTLPTALTVGNTMILKPSEQVPLSSFKIAELLREAGLPDGVLNIVNGEAGLVGEMCDHPEIKALSFVGSTGVAKIVYARGSAQGKQVIALGGAKNHLICMPDADLDYAPEQIVNSAIGCAGQRCMAASVMIAVGECSEVIDRMARFTNKVKLGSEMGAIINKASVERIEAYINQAEAMGARILADGRGARPQLSQPGVANGHWVGPTLIDKVTPNMPAARDEIFGPVLSIVHVDSLEEALKIENASPYGNAASIFTSSGASAEYLADHASAGMIGINIGVPVPREPFSFGGWNDSRFGALDITGDDGFRFWTRKKKVTQKWVNPKNPDWMS